jgi:hypothetical protein
MTAYYFAFKPTDKLRDDIQTLLTNLDAGVPEPQHKLHTQISIQMTDEVMDQLLMSIVNAMKGEGESAGILGTLAGLLRGTVHVLIKQMLGKHDNAEVRKMAQYLRDRSVIVDGEFRLGFKLPDAVGANMMTLLERTRAGEGDAVRQELVATMLQFVDLSVTHLYDEFVAPVSLGFIMRKAVDLGRSTISKGSHSAINKVFPQLRVPEMKTFAGIYAGMFVKI